MHYLLSKNKKEICYYYFQKIQGVYKIPAVLSFGKLLVPNDFKIYLSYQSQL